MEQTTLNNFFPIRKHTNADLGRKRKRGENAKGTETSSFSKNCSEAQVKTVDQREKKVAKRLHPLTSGSSPLQAGSRGMAMLRLAQQKSKTLEISTHPPPVSDSKPEPQLSSKSESPRLQRFKSLEFVSPKKSTTIRQLDFEKPSLCSPVSSNGEPQRKYKKFLELTTPPTGNTSGLESSLQCSHALPSQAERPLIQPQVPVSPYPDLPLPAGYKLIKELFQSVDTVVSMMQARGETCTFTKLKQAVERMTRRTFEMKHLGQIKTVYPEAFIFRQERKIPGTYDLQQYLQYQLTVEASSHSGQGGPQITEPSSFKGLLTQVLVGRRRHFHKNLLQIVVEHHKEFLASRIPPLEVPVDQLFRWDQDFPLNLVPDVEESSLPVPPTLDRCVSAGQILEATRTKVTERMKKALEEVAHEKELKGEGSGTCENRTEPPPTVDPLFKGISPALLERVRAKEAARAKANMTRNPQQERKIGILMRLPEFCRILNSLFVTEKKATLEWEYVVQKVVDSHSSSLSHVQVDEHLDVLAQTVPKWTQKITVRKRVYMKIDKTKDLNVVIAEVKKQVKRLQTS